ncbi:MAG: hypothetical protein DRP02_06530 [Candidatus Gerdarchaeota archaeon]|nr:MAG: hypothetical protein DRO63_03455 [Candidatus Gerdarchaeota archaeon]RLI70860.1 MAG: hypothetical protein DRP02_06530 [Candidatus Gerdarchaeota archaeon]
MSDVLKNSIKQQLKALFLLGCCLGGLPFFNLGVVATEDEVPTFFSICVLAPVTCNWRNVWSTLIVEQLPKIGIGIDVYDATGYVNIAPRVWNYPGPYPIPPYAEGGFDLLFFTWYWNLDWNPYGLFDSSSITPNGDNFYQYSNPKMDLAITKFISAPYFDDQLFWGGKIQQYLYEDLPQIALNYYSILIAHRANLEGWDPVLWVNDRCTMENWSIPGQSVFRYAVPDTFDNFYIYDRSYVCSNKFLAQIYPGLLYRRPSTGRHQFAPYLAKDYNTTDGLTYHFWLNPDVRWADGMPLNASDVVYSYEVLANVSSLQNWVWPHPLLTNLSITILSEYELEITLQTPSVCANNLFTLPLIPKHIWDSIPYADQFVQANNWAITQPNKIIGAGPYYLEEYDNNTNIIHLKQNEYFSSWNSITPHFTDIYFIFQNSQEVALNALAAGEIDMLDSEFFISIEQVPEGAAYTKVGTGYVTEIAFNNLHPILGTGEACPIAGSASAKHIRKAISYIAPREIYIAEVLEGKGEPGVTQCPPIASIYNTSLEPLPFDIERAKEEMRLSGFEYESSHPSYVIGYTLPVFLALLSLFGGTIIFLRKAKRRVE